METKKGKSQIIILPILVFSKFGESGILKVNDDTIKRFFSGGHIHEKDFDDWAVDMVDQMSKEKMIGHVHLDDNYGYQDEHLAPGEGNTPIKRMVNTLKKNGYKGELIVEPGADFTNDSGGFQSVMKTWKLFGSPIYGARSNMGTGNWNSIGGGYFGVNRPANFTVGAYSPSEDWSLWSGVPFE